MKRIVICCDGTWNDRSQHATNVAKLAQAVTPSGTAATGQVVQIVHYDPGVGTEASFAEKLLGGATGKGLTANIKQAYRFIVDNYEVGDDLYFFGFSRGADTVRSLAGLIRKCGILRKQESDRVERAYDIYRLPKNPDTVDRDGVDGTIATEFRDAYSVIPARIHFIGVWDTFGSLGIPLGRRNPITYWANRSLQFHDVDLSTRVTHAYQALAIDEKRATFTPAIWRKQPTAPADQAVEQRWFPGCHSDVGGGNAHTGLSDAALRWMIEKAVTAGLALDDAYVRERLAPRSAEIEESRTGIYSLLSSHIREPGIRENAERPDSRPELDSTQSISMAALRQRRDRTDYRPANLEVYIAAHPSIHADATEDWPGQGRVTP